MPEETNVTPVHGRSTLSNSSTLAASSTDRTKSPPKHQETPQQSCARGPYRAAENGICPATLDEGPDGGCTGEFVAELA